MAPAFPTLSRIPYEGPQSRNPLAFKHYNADEIVEGRTMKEHLRFSVVYWHTMRGAGGDMFGWGTAQRAWELGEGTVAQAQHRARCFFEFVSKLGAPYYAFHDRDVAPHGRTLAESNKKLDAVVKVMKEEMKRTGVKLLWGTAQLFVHPRYCHGAATSCNADVFAYAAAQVKKALEVTHELGGEGYVFWGGREGYSTLWNTDMKRELEHLAKFLHLAVDYKRKIGFKGQFYIEPKPKEPTKHQYDADAAACLIEKAAPNFHWVYIPHLDYAGQKFGPSSPQAMQALAELDELLGAFETRVRASSIGNDAVIVAAGEYALTDVTGAVHPNRLLREAGLLVVREEDGAELIDFASTPAFAMVDHQFAHVFVQADDEHERRRVASRVVDVFGAVDGIAHAVADGDRRQLGVAHKRSGDVVIVCDPAHWLAYYWWFDDAQAPPFARTVDIHRKPGYDPVELFFDPATKSIPLDASLVRGSHGAPVMDGNQRTALICVQASQAINPAQRYRDVDIKRLILQWLGAAT